MNYSAERLQELVDQVVEEGNWSVVDHVLYILENSNYELDEDSNVVQA